MDFVQLQAQIAEKISAKKDAYLDCMDYISGGVDYSLDAMESQGWIDALEWVQSLLTQKVDSPSTRLPSDDELLTERYEQQQRNRRFDEVNTDED